MWRASSINAEQMRCCNNHSKFSLPETPPLLEFHGSEADVAEPPRNFRRDREGRCSVPNTSGEAVRNPFVTAALRKKILLLAGIAPKVFLGWRTKILLSRRCACVRRCDGPYRLVKNRSQTSVVALTSDAPAERS
jgi:hypothetical protein